MTSPLSLAEKLARTHDLSGSELHTLIADRTDETRAYLQQQAGAVREQIYGSRVFIRGLIEFTNYCKNNCYYCGIRRGNDKAERYRLTEDDILACCAEGHALGFRTFVLQGGEDPFFTDEKLVSIVRAIRQGYPDSAITLSLGEHSEQSYRALFEAGADRYLLRHETATKAHYARLHPPEMDFDRRMTCLEQLKAIGYQVGCGFMIGSPGQTVDDLVRDLRFIKTFRPHMVGIGPFLSHQDTPFRDQPNGTAELTLYLLSILRLLLPEVLLPATTALGTAAGDGRERGILAGANVVMPNLSPVSVRKKYLLYDKKICTGEESAQCIGCLTRRMASVGCTLAVDRGDSLLH
ncbi:[FeFe] hydrogenase H-cluster radical SAM maturase HydE [Butyricicoccus sp. Marseille-Q5471]|uniref:[FeFe] hydrogenase H-cluster radical SAM maturase HydE n=1 Tax=Butyricicoccus sp. Marseille-Q5471 TaxID=3039493 RepID=UPI0024BC53FE|nr:[FeFe] hydrogenase H-cluster radical SAM maturase HydE [Butyricicoccus sp. Marseille-Q5471]